MDANNNFIRVAKMRYEQDKKKFAEHAEIAEERLEEIFAGSEMSPSEAVEIAFASNRSLIGALWEMRGPRQWPLMSDNGVARIRLKSMSTKEIAFAVFAGQFIKTEDGVHYFTYADNQVRSRIDDDILRDMQEKLLSGGYINYAKRLMKRDAPYTVSKLSECPMNHEQLMEYLIGNPSARSKTYLNLHLIVQFCNALESEREREEILNEILPYVEELGEIYAKCKVGYTKSTISVSVPGEIENVFDKRALDVSDLHSDCPAAVRIIAIIDQIFANATEIK